MQNTPHLITLIDATAETATPTRVQIAPERGAIVTSFVVGDREILYMDQATLADRSKNVRGGVPILFPSPGKLQDDAWRRDVHTGSMKQHGFARQMSWTDAQPSANTAVLSLMSNSATVAIYPWPFRATLTYQLRGACLRATLQVQNTGTSILPFALGFHPYFRVADKQRAGIRTQATKAYNNLTKQQEPFKGFDLTAMEVDVHLLDHPGDVAVLRMANEGFIAVRASSDFGIWVIWTLGGKEFVCVEPWTALGNALNTGERLIEVAPGASHESWMEISYARAESRT